MRYLAKLRAVNGGEVYCIFDDMGAVQGQGVDPKNAADYIFHKVLNVLNKKGISTKVFTLDNDFKVVSVEHWDESRSRVVQGNKTYSGYGYYFNTGGYAKLDIPELAGIKSAFNEALDLLRYEFPRINEQVVVLYEKKGK